VSPGTVSGGSGGGNGTVEFVGTYSSITWLPLFVNDSNFNFNVGAQSVATTAPEPASLSLLAIGIVSFVGYDWQRRKRVA
jgi:hypothetical protein